MARHYGWSTDYSYNCFDADEHYVVTLYRLNKKGTNWRMVEWWSYSTALSSRLAHRRAEGRIKRLREVYNAEAI